MENTRDYKDVKLVTNPMKCIKLLASPRCESYKIFTKDLVAIRMRREKVDLNKPIYAGFAILDLSKLLMADFFYNFLKPTYGSRVRLLFTVNAPRQEFTYIYQVCLGH